MKYEFIKNGKDDYTLKYKDQEINFKATVDIVKRIQEVPRLARISMISDLNKKGMTLKELTKEIKKDGKTYYDNSNKDELEKTYIEEEQSKMFQQMIEEMFNKTMLDLFNEIGLITEEEVKEFSTKIGEILTGRFQ